MPEFYTEISDILSPWTLQMGPYVLSLLIVISILMIVGPAILSVIYGLKRRREYLEARTEKPVPLPRSVPVEKKRAA